MSTLDVYGRPVRIQVIGQNGYNRILNKKDFVIMYDNNGRYSLYSHICQYAERVALTTRTIDINITQQRTPRVWKTSKEHEKSVKDIVENVDSMSEAIVVYEDIDFDDTDLILSPAPFVADKLDIHKDKDWSEFLRLIGITNLSIQKKERNISDEIQAMQGGTIASRFSRFEPRKRAIEQINKKFSQYLEKEIEVEYYDSMPNSVEKEDDSDVIYEQNDTSNVAR